MTVRDKLNVMTAIVPHDWWWPLRFPYLISPMNLLKPFKVICSGSPTQPLILPRISDIAQCLCKPVISEVPENFPTLVLLVWDLPYKTSPTGTVDCIIVNTGDYITHLFIQESSSDVLVC